MPKVNQLQPRCVSKRGNVPLVGLASTLDSKLENAKRRVSRNVRTLEPFPRLLFFDIYYNFLPINTDYTQL